MSFPQTPIAGMSLTEARKSLLLSICEQRDVILGLNPNAIALMTDDEVEKLLKNEDVRENNIALLERHIESLEEEQRGEEETAEDDPSASQPSESGAPVRTTDAEQPGSPDSTEPEDGLDIEEIERQP